MLKIKNHYSTFIITLIVIISLANLNCSVKKKEYNLRNSINSEVNLTRNLPEYYITELEMTYISNQINVWTTNIIVHNPIAIDNFTDSFEISAVSNQFRKYSPLGNSMDNNYQIDMSTYTTAQSCGIMTEDRHDFKVIKGSIEATIGTFSLKPGRMPPPKQNFIKVDDPVQFALSQNLLINKVKFTRTANDLTFSVNVPYISKFYDLGLDTASDSGTLYYIIKMIKKDISSQNMLTSDSLTINNFDKDRFIVLLFCNDTFSYNSNKCYFKHGSIKLY